VSCRQVELQAGLARASALPPEGLRLVGADLDAIGWTFAALVPSDDAQAAGRGPSSVAVFVPGGRQAGWIPGRLSEDFREMLRACALAHSGDRVGLCPAYFLRWRPDPGMLGLRLCVSWPRDVLEDPTIAVSWRAPTRLAF
jgi:hypothetical protein